MPRTLRQVAALPDLSGVRLACCMHLDMKMIPLVQGILDKGAQVFLTTCNPTTVQDDVVAWLVERGAEACAWRNMSDADWQQSWEKAIAWQPTHLCEMGADITTLLHQRGEFGNIVAGLEATGSGVNRLGDIQPGYPIFNWDDLPVKEGLHNRHMVGLTAWHTFFQTTHLTLQVLDGFLSYASALAACRMAPTAHPYLIPSHLSAEKGAQIALDALGLRPYLDMDMRLGEGSGAALAMHLLDAASVMYNQMGTLAQSNIVLPDTAPSS